MKDIKDKIIRKYSASKDQKWDSEVLGLICLGEETGALMSISGILIAICAKPAYGVILFAAAACMFFAAHNFRIAEDRKDKDTIEEEHKKQ